MIGIIPAAGKGVRFKELGKHYSKTILPYKEKPILIHQIEWLEKHGCDDIRVVLNHQEETVISILNYYNKDITITRQENQNGLSGAVYSALDKDDVGNCLVLLGDLIVDENIEYIKDSQDINYISVQKVHDYSRWCMVKDFDYGVVEFFDKPSVRPDTNLAVSGLYHFKSTKKLFKELEDQLSNEDNKISGEFQISTVLEKIAKNDKMFTINPKLIDFGTLEEYLENRSVKISRSFNEINIDGPFVTKSSRTKGEKLIAEFNWFQNLPNEVKVHTPRIFKQNFYNGNVYYQMEKVLAPSLREIYLFMDSTEETWETIFESMFDQLGTMEGFGQPNEFMKSIIQKTKDRIKDIEIPIENKLVNKFINEFESIYTEFDRPVLMHGDYCFSNLLYDFKGNITMIDPRGELFGDHYYEVAKITHSVLFDYDFVDAELYVKGTESYKLYTNGKEPVKELFKNKINEHYTVQEQKYILIITASLFLSMIPLHSHNVNNQKIYYDIFKEIYKTYKEDQVSK